MKLLSLYVVAILSVSSLYAFILSTTVSAQQLQSPRYRIESGSLQLQPDPDKSSANYDLSSSFGPESQKLFESKGYVAISRTNSNFSGRPYLRLQLSSSQLVFDKADIVDESIQKTSVKLTGSSTAPIIVAVRQADQFKNSFGAEISATHCDDKSSPCTPILAGNWRTTSGFGYRVDGSTSSDFIPEQAFRPLYVGDSAGRSAIVFRGELDNGGKMLNLQFKLRPQPQTQMGIYKSTVIITAAADY